MKASIKAKIKDYEMDKMKFKNNYIQTNEDPLIKIEYNRVSALNRESTIITKKKKIKKAVFDPLSQMNVKEDKTNSKVSKTNFTEDISKANSQANNNKDNNLDKEVLKDINIHTSKQSYSLITKDIGDDTSTGNDIFKSMENSWSALKKSLIELFCSNQNLIVKSIVSVSMDDDDDLVKNYKIDKGRTRLDELENKDKNYNVTTSGEYVAKIEVLKREMFIKWEVEDKVAAIKIMIHCTKILNDVSTPKFYCNKFLMIMEILENFSTLVYERIYKLSFPNSTFNAKQESLISPSTIKANAKDICSNWIYKCSCIRELLPRIYIDIIFLKISKFLKTEVEIEKNIISIARKIAGISNPLISYYVCTYFVKSVTYLYPKNKEYIFMIINHLSSFDINENLIKKFGFEMPGEEFEKIVEPCFEWIVYCLSIETNQSNANKLLSIYEQTKKAYILKYFIIHFPAKFVFDTNILNKILKEYKIDNVNKMIISNIFCNKLISCNLSINQEYINLLSDTILSYYNTDRSIFIEGCTLMAEVLMKFHNEEMQDKFFEAVLNNFKELFTTKTFDRKVFSKLEYFLCSIVKKMHNSSNILNIENFLIFIDNFQKDIKLNISYTILKQVISDENSSINDPYLAYVLLKIIKYIHDCLLFNKDILDQLSTNTQIEDIYKNVEKLIVMMIDKLDFGYDYESYFNFLCEIRSNIYEMQLVIERIIIEVHKICYNTFNILKGKNSKKTLRFIKVCIAFCQITVPSIKSSETKIKLFIDSASIALTNGLISEADSNIKSAITIINDYYSDDTKFTDSNNIRANNSIIPSFINTIRKLLSLVIVIPGNPDSPFQIVQGVINIFGKNWESTKIFNKKLICFELNLDIFKYLTTQLQISIPYHISNVDSNDEIFCGEEGYMTEGYQLMEYLINENMCLLENLSENKRSLNNAERLSIVNLILEMKTVLEKFSKLTKYVKGLCTKIDDLRVCF